MLQLATTLAASVAVLATTLASGPAASADTPLPSPYGASATEARPAQSLIDSVGVGVHLAYEDTPYGDAGRVAAALADLGVSHVRDDLFLDDPEQYDAIRTVASTGVRFDLIAGRPDSGRSPGEYVAQAAALAPAVEALEGPNEWDLSGRPLWAVELVAYQAGLFGAAKSDPATAALPVLAPAMAFSANLSALTALPGLADVSNGHLYTGGRAPSAGLDTLIPSLQAAAGVPPVVFTEAGYHNAVNTTDGHVPVPEDVAAAYEPRLVLEHYLRGIERVYTYELIDEFDDPGRTNPEANFGLLRHDWSPKPSYLALRNLLDLAEGTGTATNGHLDYSVSGAPADTRRVLVRRADGAYVLFLWRDVSLYDTATRTRTPVAPRTASVRLPQAMSYAVSRPTSSAAPVASGTASDVQVNLDGAVTAVVLQEPTTDAGAPTPTGATTQPAVTTPAATTTPPSKPEGVKVTPAADRAVVRWKQPTSAARRFRIDVAGRTFMASGRATRAVVTGLQPGRRYRIEVRALVGDTWSEAERIAFRTRGA